MPACIVRFLNIENSGKVIHFTADILTSQSRKSTPVTKNIIMASLYSNVPVSHGSVTMSQYVQYYDPETGAAKWNSVIIHFIIYTCDFPTDMSKCLW